MIRLNLFFLFIEQIIDQQAHTVSELASTLEVSERTIKRYKRLAIDHGFVIESKRGKYGYYRLINLPKLYIK